MLVGRDCCAVAPRIVVSTDELFSPSGRVPNTSTVQEAPAAATGSSGAGPCGAGADRSTATRPWSDTTATSVVSPTWVLDASTTCLRTHGDPAAAEVAATWPRISASAITARRIRRASVQKFIMTRYA